LFATIPGFGFLPGPIHGYSSIAVRECRVHPARPFRHTRRFDLQGHNGITFDHFGTFGFNMIVTCENGGVGMIHGTGNVTPIASTDTAIEGPSVVPPGFGPVPEQGLGFTKPIRILWDIIGPTARYRD